MVVLLDTQQYELQIDNQAVGFDLLSGCFGSTINSLILQTNIFAHVKEGQQSLEVDFISRLFLKCVEVMIYPRWTQNSLACHALVLNLCFHRYVVYA